MATELKKTSVKIWKPIIEKLDAKLEAACLRRDAYLNKLLEVELSRLDNEVSIPNSLEAQSLIASRLDHLERKTVSLSLRSDLLDRLHDICGRKRIVRDAFFNRVFLLLAASSKLIDHLVFPGDPNWRTLIWEEYKHDGPFFENTFYPLEQRIDPFWAIRLGIDLYEEDQVSIPYLEPESGKEIRVVMEDDEARPIDSLYTTLWNEQTLPKFDLFGMNLYVPNSRVPGHPAEQARRQMLDELLDIDF